MFSIHKRCLILAISLHKYLLYVICAAAECWVSESVSM